MYSMPENQNEENESQIDLDEIIEDKKLKLEL
jgi:hypothetical protein